MTEHHEVWTVPNYLQLQWRSWSDENDDQFAVFNTLSGETHCLNFTAWLILQRLEERPSTADALAAEMRAAIPDAEADVHPRITSLLKEFDEMGLIAPVRL
jgi:PqqD family protein of HPr-rel-A system